MSTEEIDLPHQEGPSWDIVGKYATYEAADIKRNELLSEENLQVKIHYQGPRNRKLFAVKKRMDPDIIKREEKKKRKARLSKKRRKK